MASGTITWDCAIAEHFLETSPSAPLPAVVLAEARYVAANVSATVTSHVRHYLPSLIRLRPSGRLPSGCERLAGSLTDGKLARVRARQIYEHYNLL